MGFLEPDAGHCHNNTETLTQECQNDSKASAAGTVTTSDTKATSVNLSPSGYIIIEGAGDQHVSGAWIHVTALDCAFYKGVYFHG